MLQPNLVRAIALKIYDLVNDPNLSQNGLHVLCESNVSDISGKVSSEAWRILGKAVPIDVQEVMEHGESMNWAAIVKIAALFVNGNVQQANTQSVEDALRSCSRSDIRTLIPLSQANTRCCGHEHWADCYF